MYGRTGTDAVVSDVRYAAAATGTPAQINKWVESNASYAPFVRVELTPYGGQFKLNGTTYTAGANVYYNYVYGLKMNLPDMSQSGVPSCARSDIKFMGWDDTNDRTGKYFGTTEELTL